MWMDGLYSSLNEARREIRLLVIQPCSTTETIVECSLETISLDGHPRYIALSYVWGDATITEEILVNGISLAATTNLAASLRQLRVSRSGERENLILNLPPLLWVDAICINQHDILERSSQVQLMSDIYSSAIKVISWLGPEADGIVESLRTLRAIAREIAQIPEAGDRFGWLQRYPKLFASGMDPQHPQPSGPVLWRRIGPLWEHEYWKRTWVLQEIVLAKGVMIMCGEEVLSWEDVLTVVNWSKSIQNTDRSPSFIDPVSWHLFASHNFFKAPPVQRIESLRNQWHGPDLRNMARRIGLRILDRSRDLKATNPRDKVYGLLGLTGVNIVPEYSKSIREVYIETAWEYLRLYGLTRTLNNARKDNVMKGTANWEHDVNAALEAETGGDTPGLPSWIPDWTSEQTELRTRKYFLDHALPNPGPITYHHDPSAPDILSVEGVQLCSIKELGLVFMDTEMAPLHGGAWLLCQEILNKYRGQMYPTGIPSLQALLRLIVDDEDRETANGRLAIPSETFFNLGAALIVHAIMHDGTHMGRSERFEKYLPKLGIASDERFARTFADQFLGPGSEAPPWSSPDQALYLNLAYSYQILMGLALILDQSRFFYTEDGYFGYGSLEIQPGDFVCALKGCEFPVILRRTDEEFKFVGTCVVQGLVDEGVLTSLIGGTESLESFDIH